LRIFDSRDPRGFSYGDDIAAEKSWHASFHIICTAHARLIAAGNRSSDMQWAPSLVKTDLCPDRLPVTQALAPTNNDSAIHRSMGARHPAIQQVHLDSQSSCHGLHPHGEGKSCADTQFAGALG